MPAPEARWLAQTCTGAAQKRFWVNTAATWLPSASSMTVGRAARLAHAGHRDAEPDARHRV